MRDERQAAPLLAATRRYLRERLAADQFVAWVAEADGRLVATSGLVFFERPPDADNLAGVDAYLVNMYTVPGWRGRGLARALLDEAVRFVKRSAARRLWLHATEEGRPVYRKAGFVPITADMELVW